MIPYLVLAEVQNVLLAAIFAFGGRVLYPTYAATRRAGKRSALEDQTVAGLIMWGPGSLIFLFPAGWLILRLLAPGADDAEPAPGPGLVLCRAPAL